jgi:hypothetical protein
MTKVFYNISTGSPAVFEDNEDMANWPNFQADEPAIAAQAVPSDRVRDDILAAIEWWGTGDHVMTAAQSQYRQDVQALTNHENWPDLSDSDWPTFPEFSLD